MMNTITDEAVELAARAVYGESIHTWAGKKWGHEAKEVQQHCRTMARAALNAALPAIREAVAGEDANVARVAARLVERSRVGIAKYGTTTERTDLSRADWLRHLQEELLDAAVYVEAALTEQENRNDQERSHDGG